MPEPLLFLTVSPVILTWSAAFGTPPMYPAVMIPSAGGVLAVELAFSTVSPPTVTHEAATPIPYGLPVALITAPHLPCRFTVRSTVTLVLQVPVHTTPGAHSGAASTADWIEEDA